MSGTVPPIPPPPCTNLGNAGSPNRVDTILNDNTEDFTSLKDRPFVRMSPLSTSTNILIKPQKQWSPEDRRPANQDKRLKSIIISCLPNDVMKSVIKCTTAQSMWNDIISAYEGPSDTRETKIDALRLKLNAFKALEGEKKLYKRPGIVGSARKPMDKSNETCFSCGKQGHFQKDCPTTKTSSQSYPSSNKPKFQSNSSQQHNQNKNTKSDYKGKYKALKSELAVLTKKIDAMSKNKNEKGLVDESFDWDEESLSSKDECVTRVKVQRLNSMTGGDETKQVLGYTYVNLHYVEDQRKNLFIKFNSLKQELSSCKYELVDLNDTKVHNISLQHEISRLNSDNESLRDEVSDLKKVIEK
ncbi:retrovirus-related pol polyprotein from transposon TNT 1-94 [Tanacetum coccineum]